MKEIQNIMICLSQQLSEFELLSSMYPDNGEIILSDKNIINEINTFLAAKADYRFPDPLEFAINIYVCGLKLEMCINLPTLYPLEGPDIYIRSNQINGQQETTLNSDLKNYIKSVVGEVCIYTAILWLQENLETYRLMETSDIQTSKEIYGSPDKESLVRLWIFSHHIYSKKKRNEIIKCAKELNVTGFCFPGKPGIICIEGLNSDCYEWWRQIKSLNWKKIMIKKTEILDISEQMTPKKFTNFEEIGNRNMSTLSEYMNELGFNECFNELFGLHSN